MKNDNTYRETVYGKVSNGMNYELVHNTPFHNTDNLAYRFSYNKLAPEWAAIMLLEAMDEESLWDASDSQLKKLWHLHADPKPVRGKNKNRVSHRSTQILQARSFIGEMKILQLINLRKFNQIKFVPIPKLTEEESKKLYKIKKQCSLFRPSKDGIEEEGNTGSGECRYYGAEKRTPSQVAENIESEQVRFSAPLCAVDWEVAMVRSASNAHLREKLSRSKYGSQESVSLFFGHLHTHNWIAITENHVSNADHSIFGSSLREIKPTSRLVEILDFIQPQQVTYAHKEGVYWFPASMRVKVKHSKGDGKFILVEEDCDASMFANDPESLAIFLDAKHDVDAINEAYRIIASDYTFKSGERDFELYKFLYRCILDVENAFKHGRLYSYMTNITRETRAALTVNGRSIIGIDLKCCQPRIMAYLCEAHEVPDDLYEIEGISRDEAKAAWLRIIHAKCFLSAAISLKQNIGCSNERANEILNTILAKFPWLNGNAFTGIGLHIMGIDGLLNRKILYDLNVVKGKFAFAVHDCWFGEEVNKDEIVESVSRIYSQVIEETCNVKNAWSPIKFELPTTQETVEMTPNQPSKKNAYLNRNKLQEAVKAEPTQVITSIVVEPPTAIEKPSSATAIAEHRMMGELVKIYKDESREGLIKLLGSGEDEICDTLSEIFSDNGIVASEQFMRDVLDLVSIGARVIRRIESEYGISV